MKRSWICAAMLTVMVCGISPGCKPPAETSPASDAAKAPAASPAATPDRRVFPVKGVVTEVIADRNKVRIAHEEIPDYMAAMTMLFDVKEARELNGLQTGDEVSFDMVVTEDDGWIENVKKIGAVAQVVSEVPSTFRLVRDVDPVDVGDPMPDYTFTNELGKVVRFSDLKGQAYAFTFIFTRCPFPDFCPRMSKFMQAVNEGMKAQEEGPDNWRLFSITIDPEFDTPKVLQAYANGYGYDPARWNYLTAPLIDITAVSEQVGLQFYRPEPDNPGGLSHNLRTVVVDAAGIIRAIIPGNEWDAAEVISALTAGAKAGAGG